MTMMPHHYIDRASGKVRTERLYQDAVVLFFYGPVRERMPFLFRMLTSAWTTQVLGYLNYDSFWGSSACRRFLRENRIDLTECLDDPARFTTPRQVFERRIRYWECRPMPLDEDCVVAPADSRVLVGSLDDNSQLYIKGKLFHYDELLGASQPQWLEEFHGGDYAVFRLTPEKYHYNHNPVGGRVVDYYEIDGAFHSCNPGAAITVAAPYSKNRRVVTVIDTDVEGGTGVGLVAMIEVVALMIGEIVQCYSEVGYDAPQPVVPGMMLRRGAAKSLFRPGSSTTVLLFQRDRVRFADDLLSNQRRPAVATRFALAFQQPLVETDVTARSAVARAAAVAAFRQAS
ncbi:MAG TPA: phosphatidylserine decarboxylase [Acidiferrobacterales bacterium]